MSYIVPVHHPTAIRHALCMRFLSPNANDLIFAKGSRIEIWRLEDGGLKRKHTTLIHGTITMMQRLEPRDSDTDLLFIGTERQHYITLEWNPQTHAVELVGQKITDHSEPLMRQFQSINRCLVDPTGLFLVLHLWEGVMNILRLPARNKDRLKMKNLVALASIRHTELWIKASTFIHSRTGHPRIAFLYKSRQDIEQSRIVVYRLTKDDNGTEASAFTPDKDRELDEELLDPYSSMLIPVPVPEEKRYHVRKTEGTKLHLGGLVVIGETLLTYFDSLTYSKLSTPLKESKLYISWVEIDPMHYLLADDFGVMDLLTIETVTEPTGIVVRGLSTRTMQFENPWQRTCRASKMVHLGDGYVFLASTSGDPQLLRVDIGTGQMFLIGSESNNAPILDFALMDLTNQEDKIQSAAAYSTGQARLVAGCGAYRDGTLRSIRSGIGLEDSVLLDIEGTRGLFSVWSHGARMADTLVVSFINHTRIFLFDSNGGAEEVSKYQGMTLDSETLVARSLPSGRLLQITPQMVFLLDPESGMAISEWSVTGDSSITAASANDKWALLSIDGSILVRLDLENDLNEKRKEAEAGDSTILGGDQISCICAAQTPEHLGVVGWWASGEVSVIDIATLEPLHRETVKPSEDSASVPRDIALVQLHPHSKSGPTLLIATEDGSVITYNVSTSNGVAVSGRKCVILGSSPARLHLLPHSSGQCSVFATTDISSLIHSADGRVMYSATSADDATFVSSFSSEAYPGHIVISTNKQIRISMLDTDRLTHVKSLAIGESVRRMTYSPELKAFALGCIKKELILDREEITSTIKLVDEIAFNELGRPLLLNEASGVELVECVIRAQLYDSKGNLAERFIVGTSHILSDDAAKAGNGTRGRILVLGVDERRQLYQILSRPIKGACHCLGVLDGKIVAGLQKTLVIYEYSEETSATGSLRLLASYRPANTPVALDISDGIIGVADISQSLALVQYVPPKIGEAAKLVECARHFEPSWSTAMSALGDEKWLETDMCGNLCVLRRNIEAATAQDRAKMEILSDINIGEQINKIKRIYVPPNDKAVVCPKAFLASTEGSVHLFGEVMPQYQSLLIEFQDRLSKHIQAPGNIPFEEWRAYRSEVRERDGPYRFLDGELLERFLDMNEAMQDSVCDGLDASVEAMRNIVEELKRMH